MKSDEKNKDELELEMMGLKSPKGLISLIDNGDRKSDEQKK